MALVTSNSQGELSPLERGIHFNRAGVGVREYARQLEMSKTYVYECISAARVVTFVLDKMSGQPDILGTKTQHLAAIHALPPDCWPEAVQAMLERGWSAKETAERVKVPLSGRHRPECRDPH